MPSVRARVSWSAVTTGLPVTSALNCSRLPIKTKSAHWSPRTVTIEQLNLKHLKPIFGGMPLCDITSDALAGYQLARLKEEASPKTINLEIGTLRGILRKHRLWGNLQPDVRMLRQVMTLA
jgi:hypothetical protein